MQLDHYHQHIARKKKLNLILYVVTFIILSTLILALILTW